MIGVLHNLDLRTTNVPSPAFSLFGEDYIWILHCHMCRRLFIATVICLIIKLLMCGLVLKWQLSPCKTLFEFPFVSRLKSKISIRFERVELILPGSPAPVSILVHSCLYAYYPSVVQVRQYFCASRSSNVHAEGEW